MKKEFENNPVYFSNERMRALEEAYVALLESVDMFAKTNNLDKDEINGLIEMINSIYLEKKMVYYLSEKIGNMSVNIHKNISRAMVDSNKKNKNIDITSLFYYNKKHRVTNHEQFA